MKSRAEYFREYHKKNKDKRNKRAKEYYYKNKEKFQEYYEKNKAYIVAYQKEYHKKKNKK